MPRNLKTALIETTHPTLAKVSEGYWRNAETEVHVFTVTGGYLPCTTNRYGTSVPITSGPAATMKQARGIAERWAARVRDDITAAHTEALRLVGTR